MTKQEKQAIQIWEDGCNKIADVFATKYFTKCWAEYDWIGGDIGGAISIFDYFFSLDNMVGYMRNNYTKKDMFNHYDYNLDSVTKGQTPLNIKCWRTMKNNNFKNYGKTKTQTPQSDLGTGTVGPKAKKRTVKD